MFRIQQRQLKDKYSRWRKQAKLVSLSPEGTQRLEWMILLDKGESVENVCREYNVKKSVVYKWKSRFQESRIKSLETLSRKPHNTRKCFKNRDLEYRIIQLRKNRMVQGKMKLKRVYEETFHEKVSSYRIQKVINEYDLYPTYQKVKKKKASKERLRIRDYEGTPSTFGEIVHLDTIEIRMGEMKRYIMTAIDTVTRIGFAYAYEEHSSENARDFLRKVVDIWGESTIQNIHTDNGSEFEKYFKQEVKRLKYTHWYSRVRVSTDNGKCERFNRTVQDEWLHLVGFIKDLTVFNASLLNFIYSYNYSRPHYSLNYSTPFSFLSSFSTMSSSYTNP